MVTQEIETSIQERKVDLQLMDGSVQTITAQNAGLSYQNQGTVAQALEGQNAFLWPLAMMSSEVKEISLESRDLLLDQNVLNQNIAFLESVSSPAVVAPQNAQVVYSPETGAFVIQDAVDGNQIDAQKLSESVGNALYTGVDAINVKDQNLYVEAEVRADNEALIQHRDLLNQKLGAELTYRLGENDEIIDKDLYAQWLSVNESGEVTVSDEGIQSFLNQLDNYYWIFETEEQAKAVDKAITAYLIDLDAEPARIKDVILNGKTEIVEPQSVKVEPVPVTLTSSIDSASGALTNSQGGSTYVLIDIASQSMFFWKNGELLVSTPVTTGTLGKYDTPTGKFTLQGKSMNITLRGDGYASPVTYWLPFYQDYGIHDSSWRSNYGGSIYQTSGSHGCINTPFDAVSVIFNNIEVGTTVIVQ